MNIDTLVLLLMRNVNNFQIAKIHPQSVLSICLSFCQFQPGVLIKKVLLIKKRVLQLSEMHGAGKLKVARQDYFLPQRNY